MKFKKFIFLIKKIFLLFFFIYTFNLNILIVKAETEKADSKIKLMSPGKQSLVKYNQILIIGEVIGCDSVDLEVNSKDKLKLKVEKNTFYSKIDLKSGENIVKIEALSKGKSIDSQKIKIFYTKDMKSEDNPKEYTPYFFHTMLIEDGECTECHDLKLSIDKYMLKKADRGLCFNCHDERLDVKFVHGPVAGGACLSCHNPHGSQYEYTVRYEGNKLCWFCHEVDRINTEHIAKLKPEDAQKLCISCHDVHGNNKQYFLKN